VSPTYVFDIAAATRALIRADAAAGLYHCVNTGACSWRDIALEIAHLLGRELQLTPITLDSVMLRAPRPKFSALDNTKLRALGIVMPTWQDALARHLKRSA
jgi:dTDP-4-dehydrorhamnose reductase